MVGDMEPIRSTVRHHLFVYTIFLDSDELHCSLSEEKLEELYEFFTLAKHVLNVMFPFIYCREEGREMARLLWGDKGRLRSRRSKATRKLSARPWKASDFPTLQALSSKTETF
ncbi:hypothetical protein EQV77_15860 [Halobacillus fulvus]|nr:hypothetical protein EQV77_15860 [Halobacillus fulvus]